jgi:hypothetical protein
MDTHKECLQTMRETTVESSEGSLFIHATVRSQVFKLGKISREGAVAGHRAELESCSGIKLDVGVPKTVLEFRQEVRKGGQDGRVRQQE